MSSSVSYTLYRSVLGLSGGVCPSHLSISFHHTMSSHISTVALFHLLYLDVVRSPIPTTLVLLTGSGEARAQSMPLTPCLQPCGFPWICPARLFHLKSFHIVLSCSGPLVPSSLAPPSLVALLPLSRPYSIHFPVPAASPPLHLLLPLSFALPPTFFLAPRSGLVHSTPHWPPSHHSILLLTYPLPFPKPTYRTHSCSFPLSLPSLLFPPSLNCPPPPMSFHLLSWL